MPADLPRLSDHQRQELFHWALTNLPGSDGLRMVISDAGTAPNYDPRSGALACDLLAGILARATRFGPELRQDLFDQLELQMHDSWTTGRCPQGRTTRLYQIWMSLPSPPRST